MSKFKFRSLLCPDEMVTAEQLETDRKLLAFDRTLAHLNRRGFLGAFAAAAAGGAMLSHAGKAEAQTVGVTDVLNFALNLEYLEASFYLYVTTGGGVSVADAGAGYGLVTGGAKISLDAPTLAVAQALAADEVHHIETLRSTITSLGGTPISMPAINLAANGPVTTQAQFLSAARQFTALGGSAYVGGSIMLVSNPAVLTAAAQILGAEGQHAGALAYLCVSQGVNSPAIDAQDVPPSATNYFTVAQTTALSPARTPQQALGVVYRTSTPTTTTPSAGTMMGGFFPNGVNGLVKST